MPRISEYHLKFFKGICRDCKEPGDMKNFDYNGGSPRCTACGGILDPSPERLQCIAKASDRRVVRSDS